MENNFKILIIEDIRGAEREKTALRQAQMTFESIRAGNAGELVQRLEDLMPDVVVCILPEPAHGAWSPLEPLQARKSDVPYVVVADSIEEKEVLDALRRGASDIVVKSNLMHLPDAVRYAAVEGAKRRSTSRLERMQAVRLGIASAIVRNADQHKLLETACRIAVELGAFRMAWVGCVSPEALTLVPVACSGHDDGYLQRATAVRVREAECKGKGESMKRYGSVVVNDIRNERSFILKDEALARGYRSMIALPLIVEHRVMAIFKIYASEPRYFGNEARTVLADVAADLSYALEQQVRQERLSRLAYRDALTGLANRRLLMEQLNQELARAHRLDTRVAVVFIDIDDFKMVNDTYGHSVGDRLLIEMSSRMVSCTREGDIVARLGGDEFVMVLPLERGRETVAPIIERTIESISRPLRVEHQRLKVTCSVGVAVFPQDGVDYASLLKAADAAMYDAKTSVSSARANPGTPKRKLAAA
jgi:diguanylate cyclase (GGDEF)-like protein